MAAPANLTPRALTKRRATVLDFIRAEIGAGRPFPRPAAIAAHMGWRADSASDCLIGLAVDGCIVSVGREPRTRRVLYELTESHAPAPAGRPAGHDERQAGGEIG